MSAIPYIDLTAQYRSLKTQIDSAVHRVLESGRYIGGPEVEKFEASMAAYLGSKHVISVGNGYDALFLSLKALGVGAGDQVVCDHYTHVSTHAAAFNCGAILRTGEPSADDRVWIPVHMNGRCQEILNPKIAVVEDACQAIGASYNGKKAGTFGMLGCFSLHPMKILGCAGDGGFICTDDDHLALSIRSLRNHGGGMGYYGMNSRLDNLQAAILNVKIPYLDGWIKKRRDIAAIYNDSVKDRFQKPEPPSDGPHYDVYSSYVLNAGRDGPALLKHLRCKGVECFSHVYESCVSLPIYPEIPMFHVEQVINAVNSF